MKKGDIIDVYDGDFIGWTKATLVDFIHEANGYEKWKMITTEGYTLERYVGLIEAHQPRYLTKPVRFQRKSRSKWEEGMHYIYMDGRKAEIIKNSGEVINSWFKSEANWGI